MGDVGDSYNHGSGPYDPSRSWNYIILSLPLLQVRLKLKFVFSLYYM